MSYQMGLLLDAGKALILIHQVNKPFVPWTYFEFYFATMGNCNVLLLFKTSNIMNSNNADILHNLWKAK